MSISKKQREILEYIIRRQEVKAYPPSVREICEAVGLRSTSTVHGHLTRLEEKGYIRRDPAKTRAIEICRRPEKEDSLSGQSFIPSERVVAFQNPVQGPELIAVPILGRVRAGEPILAVENIEDYFPIPVDFTHNSECFMLRVQGESMINVGIYENDLILIRKQNTAVNHDKVVALLGDSVTVKTFYKEKDYIRLQPENDHMDPILVKDCIILGKVIGLFRSIM
ncbi:MAG: transcriptional repressor LexA [Lachnospiraceae bacterium]|jgi:repressor LexA|nr:transcriptional repressor LexA [Lachnospiraceae bacterium]